MLDHNRTIAASQVAGVDETGLRVAGGSQRVHCARTDKDTLITCHPKRGTAGINAAGTLPHFTGVGVHYGWAPYDTYIDAGHQLCYAHALRELQGVADTADLGSDWCCATQSATPWSRWNASSPNSRTVRRHSHPALVVVDYLGLCDRDGDLAAEEEDAAGTVERVLRVKDVVHEAEPEKTELCDTAELA